MSPLIKYQLLKVIMWELFILDKTILYGSETFYLLSN